MYLEAMSLFSPNSATKNEGLGKDWRGSSKMFAR